MPSLRPNTMLSSAASAAGGRAYSKYAVGLNTVDLAEALAFPFSGTEHVVGNCLEDLIVAAEEGPGNGTDDDRQD